METDKVHTTLYTIQQSAQLLDMCGRIVQPLHYDILKRYAALTRKVVTAQNVAHLTDGVGILDRHNLLALIVERVVQTDGQMHLRL
jgi:hypothetical protein